MNIYEQRQREKKDEINQLKIKVVEIEEEISSRYREVQDFTASQQKYEAFVKWKPVQDREIKRLKTKINKLRDELH